MTITFASLSHVLMGMMQVSVLVPLLACWHNWPVLPAPLRRLAWYFPLSVMSVVVAHGLTYAWVLGYPVNNFIPIIAFNVGKTLLLGWALRQALRDRGARRITGAALGLGLAAVAAGLLGLPLMNAVAVARLAQCVVLAVVALAYLEQLSRSPGDVLGDDPYFWLGTGQLVYSAATVVAISLAELNAIEMVRSITLFCMALAGLFQNFTLTKTYLVGCRPVGAGVP